MRPCRRSVSFIDCRWRTTISGLQWPGQVSRSELLQRLGKHPVVLPFKPNGKAQHVKGFLKAFARNAQNTSDFLKQVAEVEIPMIGIDAALVLCYRDEYRQALKEKRGEFTVNTAHEWLVDTLNEWPPVSVSDEEPWYLMAAIHRKDQNPAD